jgi:hypothetical protein
LFATHYFILNRSTLRTQICISIFVKTLLEYQCFIYIKIQSIRTQIIVKTKKVKEAEKFVSQKIFEYDNCQISEYDYVKSISYRQIDIRLIIN